MASPERICSLLPSATEIVFALGLGDRLVGVTHECDHPEDATRLPVVTRSTLGQVRRSRDIDTHVAGAVHVGSSIYSLDQELLARLNPDLILTQELCVVCAVTYRIVDAAVRELEGPHRILSLEPDSLDGILRTITEVGAVTDRSMDAGRVVERLRDRIDAIASDASRARHRPRIFAMEWLDPPFTAGHWVPEMIHLAGGRDELATEGEPSSRIDWSRIADYDPKVIVLMPCGFTVPGTLAELREIDRPREWSRLRAVREGEVYVVDGSAYFNRPGPRIVDGLEILAEILHPELFPRVTPPAAWQRLVIAEQFA